MEKLQTELLIIGGGAAGMAAAAAAAERGVTVMVAEKNAAVGGNGLFPRGVFGVDSRLQRQRLIFADADALFAQCMEYSHWKIDGRLIRILIDRSGDTVDWLMDKGVPFCDVVHHVPNQAPEVFHITAPQENAGKAVIRCLKQFCQDRGVRLMTGLAGQRLEKDAGGAVCGAVCRDKQGREVEITAKKVIVCTGGFAGNPEMVRRYYPSFRPDQVPAGGGMRHTGDGVRMALEAGADIEGNFAMEIAAPKIQGYDALNLLLGKPYAVWLNGLGQRFADEGIVYNFAMAANACMRQPSGRMWVVFSESMRKKALADGRDMIELIHIAPDAEERLDDTIEQAIRDGVMARSDSFEGLAPFIGCAPEAVRSALEEYNAFCRNGRDALFAKQRRNLLPLEEGPFYAVRAGADMLITHGGIRVNERFQALDGSFRPVGNLFVAGVDFGGADADVYNVEMSGHGFGFALNSGRMAGENAAAELMESDA